MCLEEMQIDHRIATYVQATSKEGEIKEGVWRLTSESRLRAERGKTILQIDDAGGCDDTSAKVTIVEIGTLSRAAKSRTGHSNPECALSKWLAE